MRKVVVDRSLVRWLRLVLVLGVLVAAWGARSLGRGLGGRPRCRRHGPFRSGAWGETTILVAGTARIRVTGRGVRLAAVTGLVGT